jgi:zinc protease
MADLSAASLEDVKNFFRMYYAPNNAAIVVSGDVRADSVKRIVERYFGAIPRGPAITRPAPASFVLQRDTSLVLEDRVQLPRLYYAWHTVKGWHADDAPLHVVAYLLTGARNARLTRLMVYDKQDASNVFAYQNGARLDGDFRVVATARPGHALPELQHDVDSTLQRLAAEGPTDRELQQARNSLEADFLNGIESVRAKANQLNDYYYAIGTPDGFQRDLDRLRAVTAADVQRVVRQYLAGPRVIISVVPQGKQDLAAAQRGTP